MKYLLNKLNGFIESYRNDKKQKLLRKEIFEYTNANLSTYEIETFLDVKFSSFDQDYFDKYYPAYAYLLNDINSLQLMNYIESKQVYKSTIKNKLTKSLAYPLLLLVFSIVVIIIFKHAIIPLFMEYVNLYILVIINLAYYLTLLFLLILLVLSIILIYLLLNRDLYIIFYKRISNLISFALLEVYYQQIFTHLIISNYHLGLSTKDIFININRFKDNPITANLAYFISDELDLGRGLEKGIQAMQTSEQFKKILRIALEREDFIGVLEAYNKSLNLKIDKLISNYTKRLYIFTYIYILILLMVFYMILSLPLNMIDIL